MAVIRKQNNLNVEIIRPDVISTTYENQKASVAPFMSKPVTFSNVVKDLGIKGKTSGINETVKQDIKAFEESIKTPAGSTAVNNTLVKKSPLDGLNIAKGGDFSNVEKKTLADYMPKSENVSRSGNIIWYVVGVVLLFFYLKK